MNSRRKLPVASCSSHQTQTHDNWCIKICPPNAKRIIALGSLNRKIVFKIESARSLSPKHNHIWATETEYPALIYVSLLMTSPARIRSRAPLGPNRSVFGPQSWSRKDERAKLVEWLAAGLLLPTPPGGQDIKQLHYLQISKSNTRKNRRLSSPKIAPWL